MPTTKRVIDCYNKAEWLRTKARVFNRIREFLVVHFGFGNGPNKIPHDLFNEISEQMLVEANRAEQEAQRLMATPVHHYDVATGGKDVVVVVRSPPKLRKAAP